MKVKQLYIQNFRGLTEETIDFRESVTVLAGKNGSGKSTVLEAVAIMLSWLPVKISSFAMPRKIKSSDITGGKDFAQIKITLSRNSDPHDDIRLTLFKVGENATAKRRSSAVPPSLRSNMRAASRFGSDMRVVLDSDDATNIDIPVFAFYGAKRDVNGIPAPRPDITDDRTKIYRDAFKAGANFENYEKWIVSAMKQREGEIAAAAKMPLKKGNAMRDKITAKYASLAYVRHALEEFSESFSGFELRNGELYLKSKNIAAKYLSDGEKTLIALIADIAARMAVANPNRANPLSASAIVLIDELDLHLHPVWQAAIADKLPRIFTNTQFIISTHSPSIMAATRSLYRLNDERNVDKFEEVESPFGREPSDVLKNVLEAKREDSIGNKISLMYSLLDDRKFDAARRIIEELDAEVPDDPDVLRGEYLLRSLCCKPDDA